MSRAKKNSPSLSSVVSWQKFGRRLFEEEDADPGYMLLARADMTPSQKMRFMAAWVTYYHPGIAARASEFRGPMFWAYLYSRYKDAPRASERRHFRGDQGMRALKQWSTVWQKMPEGLVLHMRGRTYFDVRVKAKTVPQIGPYFIWKFADVQDRVFRFPCDFTGAAPFSPKVPQEGAQIIGLPGDTVEQTYAMISHNLNRHGLLAPPWYDRPMNMQEAETVCCVYKQYLNGSYTWHSRTAKATKRLLAEPCMATDALIAALHDPATNLDIRPTRGLSHKELGQWADSVLASLP